MGEVLDFTKFEQVTKKKKKEIDEKLIDNITDLVLSGKPRNSIKLDLRNMGYNMEDAEKIVSMAELKAYSKPKRKINFPVLFLASVLAIAALGVIVYFVFLASSPAADCGSDTFCVQKIIDCQAGSYRSTYRGISNEYRITNSGNYCQVFVKVLKSSSQTILPQMSMNCLYPIVDGKTDLSDSQSNCDGSLVSVLGP